MRQKNGGRSIVFDVGIFAQDVGRLRTLVKPTSRTRVERLRTHFRVDERIAAFRIIIAAHLAFLLRRRRKRRKPEPFVLRTLVERFAARQKESGKEKARRRANAPPSLSILRQTALSFFRRRTARSYSNRLSSAKVRIFLTLSFISNYFKSKKYRPSR